ncbi:MAG: ferritin-like domain-containing protein [Alphaproteobacteria bacterium]|nr:ferritin-like domain-containing protein [Alphaproteobacteria bacterium]
MAHWTLDDIDWSAFDASKACPDLLQVAKAAALVERNGLDYAVYLRNVFAGDDAFCAAVDEWAREEVLHGEALARWSRLADPAWDFEAASARFSAAYALPLDATASVRGSRTGELIARCIVETGTSSYYGAIADAAREPVLAQVCRRIAADEFRHYKLFHDHMRRYLDAERIGRLGRLRAGLGRMLEAGDDELACAFHAANAPPGVPYERRRWSRAYARRAYALYGARHVERGLAMVLKAIGLQPTGRLHALLSALALRFLGWRARSLARAGA